MIIRRAKWIATRLEQRNRTLSLRGLLGLALIVLLLVLGLDRVSLLDFTLLSLVILNY